MKLDVDDFIGAMNLAGIDQEDKKAVLEVVNKLLKEKEDEKLPKAKKSKKDLVVFLKSDQEIPGDVIALVTEIGEGVDYNLTWGSIRKAAVSFNEAQKKNKNKITRFRDVGLIKPKYQKEEGVKIYGKGQWAATVKVSEKEDENFLNH